MCIFYHSRVGMGLYKAVKVEKMTDEKIVSLRMGTEELQRMDDFLEGHPELGGRSLFIRTAIRQYIDRDADVPTSNKNTVTVRLARTELETLQSMVDDGTYIDCADAIRNIIQNKFTMDPVVTKVLQTRYNDAVNALR